MRNSVDNKENSLNFVRFKKNLKENSFLAIDFLNFSAEELSILKKECNLKNKNISASRFLKNLNQNYKKFQDSIKENLTFYNQTNQYLFQAKNEIQKNTMPLSSLMIMKN